MTVESRNSFTLGSKAKDTITGFEGIITAVTHWYSGCTRYAILSTKLDKEGKVRPEEWFDEERVKVIKSPAKKKAKAPIGGPPVGGVEAG